ncbi:hypothetical protein K1W54_19550 [Micromonospora sp. CPCC 205371]|nr:hypothetical protein [Micromonospora sp. CPCC 205371]
MGTAVVATLAASAVPVMVQGVVEAEQDARRGQAGPGTPYTAGVVGVEVCAGVLVTEIAYWGARPRVLVTQRELRRGLERRGLVRRWWVRALVPLGLAVVPGVLVARLVSLDVIVPQVGVAGVVAGAAVAVWFLPRRTVAGARLLRRLRVDHADLVAELESGRAQLDAWAPERVGVAVALYGDAAVVAIMPAVARGLGLVDGGRWTRFVRHNSDRYGPWTAEAMSEIDRENPTTPF